MLLIDRAIIRQFLGNFVNLFALLFIFAVTIDVMLQLDEFVEVAQEAAGADAGPIAIVAHVVRTVLNFHGPRVFQFYSYLHGLIAIGAASFSLAQLHRNRELVALMAAGMSLHRVAWPFVLAAFALNVVQLANQELMLPRVAPLLIREREDIGRRSVEAFPVTFTRDGRDNLLLAGSFDPRAARLRDVTVLVRDEDGRTAARITADAATWSEAAQGWALEAGVMARLRAAADEDPTRPLRQPHELYETDLTPDSLLMRRYRQYASMLSSRQISRMLESSEVVDRRALLRHRYHRFAAVVSNLLVLVICLPFFLVREPTNLLRRSVLCAATAIPLTVAVILGMALRTPLPPALAVFMPALVLSIVALWRAMELKS